MEEPLISIISVEAGLNMLRTYDNVSTTSAVTLTSLFLIQSAKQSPFIPKVPKTEIDDYLVKQLLTETIIGLLSQLRESHNLLPPNRGDNLNIVRNQIALDSQTGSKEVLGMSYLYAYYVRSELNITQSDFESICHMATRTIARYRLQAITILTEHIIELEWLEREKQRLTYLKSKLPPMREDISVGREAELTRGLNTFKKPNATLAVIGEVGIGKTHFIQKIARILIEQHYENVIWIEKPLNMLQAVNTIKASFDNIGNDNLNLQQNLLLQQTLIIIDNVDKLIRSNQLKDLLQELDNASVIFTASTVVTSTIVTTEIHLRTLSYNETVTLIRDIYARKNWLDYKNDAEWIWQQTGGHPEAIILAATTNHIDTKDNPFRSIYKTLFDDLSTNSKLLWLLIALLEENLEENYVMALSSTLGINQSRQSFNLLIKQSIIQKDFQGFVNLQQSAKRFIQNQPDVAQPLCEMLIQSLLEAPRSLQLLPLLEAILLSHACYLAPVINHLSIEQYALLGYEQEHFVTWYKIFLRYEDILTPALLHIYGQLLHKIGQSKVSIEIFDGLITTSGSSGEFEFQLKVQLSKIKALLSLGQYDYATALLNHIEKSLTNSKQQNNIALIKAQIAIDRNDKEMAQALSIHYVDRIPTNLRADLYYLLGDYKQSLSIATEGISSSETIEDIAMLYNTIGRCNMHLNQPYIAIDFFNASLTLLERSNLYRAQARIQHNLGIALSKVGQAQEAITLLNKCLRLQETFEDAVGITLTRHNLQLLKQRNLKI